MYTISKILELEQIRAEEIMTNLRINFPHILIIADVKTQTKRMIRFKKKAIPFSLKLQVFQTQPNKCAFCGVTENLCIDHIIPESKGGKNDLANFQILCRNCNSKKYTKILTK